MLSRQKHLHQVGLGRFLSLITIFQTYTIKIEQMIVRIVMHARSLAILLVQPKSIPLLPVQNKSFDGEDRDERRRLQYRGNAVMAREYAATIGNAEGLSRLLRLAYSLTSVHRANALDSPTPTTLQ